MYICIYGTVIQLQGDIRKDIAVFLIEVTALITKDQVWLFSRLPLTGLI